MNRFIFILITVLSILSPINGFSENNNTIISVIPVAGTIDPSAKAFIERSVKESIDKKSSYIIFEMDTFGGALNSAYNIVETITNIPKDIKSIAFVRTKAISAGALISIACNQIYMKESTTIGDCAPISYYNNEVKMLGEKFQSPLRAKFRSLAKKNGYNQKLAESMVSKDIEVFKIKFRDGSHKYLDKKGLDELGSDEVKGIVKKTLVVKKGELLTMDNSEAMKLGFSSNTVQSIDEILKELKVEDPQILKFRLNWSENLVNYILPFTPILLIIGLMALFAEFKMPGFGLPGATAAICFILALGSQYFVGLANYTEFLILGMGLLLLGLEIFVIPGFGVAGISGFVFIITGLVLSLQDFTIPNYPWEKEIFFKNLSIILSSVVVAFIGSMLIFRYVFAKLSRGERGPYLNKTLKESKARSFETDSVKKGDTGVAGSYLRPSGKIIIDGNYIDAISEGEFIEEGVEVVILRISGNSVIVARKEN